MNRSYTLDRKHRSASVYIDEEECLGVDVFASELELLCGGAKLHGRWVPGHDPHPKSWLMELSPSQLP
jgi:hypothetical protein